MIELTDNAVYTLKYLLNIGYVVVELNYFTGIPEHTLLFHEDDVTLEALKELEGHGLVTYRAVGRYSGVYVLRSEPVSKEMTDELAATTGTAGHRRSHGV